MADPSPLSLIARWPAKVAEEILLAPWTIRQVRTSLTELPVRLDALTATLGDTIGALDALLPTLDERIGGLATDLTAFRSTLEKLLPELSTLVGSMDDRVEHVEHMVTDLGEALLNLMGSIPGVRRAVRDVRPTPR
jgi:ABC-type transporter Mla subunit MlaD